MLPPVLSWLPRGKAHRPPLPLRAALPPSADPQGSRPGLHSGPTTRWAGAQWALLGGQVRARGSRSGQRADPAQYQSSSLGSGSLPGPGLRSPTPKHLATGWAHEQVCNLVSAMTARKAEEIEAPHVRFHRHVQPARGRGREAETLISHFKYHRGAEGQHGLSSHQHSVPCLLS